MLKYSIYLRMFISVYYYYSAPLKLRPYGAIQICLLLLFIIIIMRQMSNRTQINEYLSATAHVTRSFSARYVFADGWVIPVLAFLSLNVTLDAAHERPHCRMMTEEKKLQSVMPTFVVIGLSPPLAYCAIFSVISSHVVDLHICICMRVSSYQSLIVPVYSTHRLHDAAALARPARAAPFNVLIWLTCSVYRPCWPVYLFTTAWPKVTWPPLCFKLRRGFTTLSRQTLLSEDRQCCESWRDAELGVGAVCGVRDRLETRGESGSESPSDTTGEDLVLVRWVVLPRFSPRRDTAVSYLTNDTLTTSMLRRLTAGITDRSTPSYDASSPFLRCRLLHRVTTRLLLSACCLSPATSFG